MDEQTTKAYSQNAQAYSQDWLSQPEPTDMYELLKKFFIPGGKTADIGCGNGRDAAWLAKQGFHVQGFDSSAELVSLASRLYPQLSFKMATLPLLSEITEQFQNVLCETVIMHLTREQITQSIQHLKRITMSGGVLYLSWRVTEGQDSRHADGRLYSSFDADFVLNHFDSQPILHFEDQISASSAKRVCRLVCRG